MQHAPQKRTISSRDFNQDVAKAKRAAQAGPVTITDRGRPAFVLMRYEDYLRFSERQRSLVDMLRDDRPEADFDFAFPRLRDDMGLRIPDFSDNLAPPDLPPTTAKLTSREFNQDVGKAKRAAERGSVVITDRGKPAFVLMRHAEYHRLFGRRPGLSELLNDEATKDLEFEPVRIQDGWLRPADFD